MNSSKRYFWGGFFAGMMDVLWIIVYPVPSWRKRVSEAREWYWNDFPILNKRTGDVDHVNYYTRTYSLKTKDGVYAWIYDDGTERFPGITFDSPQEAEEYFVKRYGRSYIRFKAN